MQVQRLRDVNESDGASEGSMTTYVRVLSGLAGDERGTDPWRDDYVQKLDEAVNAAIEKYPARGFEIVGVTLYYNFQWDDEAKRASRAKEDVAPEEERQTLRNFLEHHNLEHPVLVTPGGSKMPGEFVVRGIPHVVLIDRQGIVQLVKTGVGQAMADEIHAKIKELLGDDNS